jgi:magnesium chelatase family protein
MDTSLMQIESSFTRGFSGMQLIGNASEVCRDGKERARAALENMGLSLPPRRLLVSLTPGDLKKDGSQFDLPLAVSLALLLREKPARFEPREWLFAAELGLNGELRPVKGVVSFALAAMSKGLKGIVVAKANRHEVEALAALNAHDPSKRLQIKAFGCLQQVLNWLFDAPTEEIGEEVGDVGGSLSDSTAPPVETAATCDFDDMLLHPSLARAAMTAAAGLHSLLLRGSPGTGKSMLAARLPSIMPLMAVQDHIEALKIHSLVAERLPKSLLAGRPFFRSPHHQASAAAILGTGDHPGELSLAHGGVLFLDELPEYRRDLLEALREPLETGEVRIARSRKKGVWKARVLLVAAANNCPCGYFGSARRGCRCSSPRLLAYRQRLSGPVLDRIDLHLNVPESEEDSAGLFLRLAKDEGGSQTERMLATVKAARALAAARNQAFGVTYNSELPAKDLLSASRLGREDFAKWVSQIIPASASSRAVLRTLRVARTLADLDGEEVLRREDIAAAWHWQAEPAARARGEYLMG